MQIAGCPTLQAGRHERLCSSQERGPGATALRETNRRSGSVCFTSSIFLCTGYPVHPWALGCRRTGRGRRRHLRCEHASEARPEAGWHTASKEMLGKALGETSVYGFGVSGFSGLSRLFLQLSHKSSGRAPCSGRGGPEPRAATPAIALAVSLAAWPQ